MDTALDNMEMARIGRMYANEDLSSLTWARGLNREWPLGLDHRPLEPQQSTVSINVGNKQEVYRKYACSRAMHLVDRETYNLHMWLPLPPEPASSKYMHDIIFPEKYWVDFKNGKGYDRRPDNVRTICEAAGDAFDLYWFRDRAFVLIVFSPVMTGKILTPKLFSKAYEKYGDKMEHIPVAPIYNCDNPFYTASYRAFKLLRSQSTISAEKGTSGAQIMASTQQKQPTTQTQTKVQQPTQPSIQKQTFGGPSSGSATIKPGVPQQSPISNPGQSSSKTIFQPTSGAKVLASGKIYVEDLPPPSSQHKPDPRVTFQGNAGPSTKPLNPGQFMTQQHDTPAQPAQKPIVLSPAQPLKPDTPSQQSKLGPSAKPFNQVQNVPQKPDTTSQPIQNPMGQSKGIPVKTELKLPPQKSTAPFGTKIQALAPGTPKQNLVMPKVNTPRTGTPGAPETQSQHPPLHLPETKKK